MLSGSVNDMNSKWTSCKVTMKYLTHVYLWWRECTYSNKQQFLTLLMEMITSQFDFSSELLARFTNEDFWYLQTENEETSPATTELTMDVTMDDREGHIVHPTRGRLDTYIFEVCLACPIICKEFETMLCEEYTLFYVIII